MAGGDEDGHSARVTWGEKVVGVVPVVMPASTSQEMAVLAKLVVGTSVKLWGPAGAGSPALRQRKTAISARVTCCWGRRWWVWCRW
jgi:hypothetical protein